MRGDDAARIEATLHQAGRRRRAGARSRGRPSGFAAGDRIRFGAMTTMPASLGALDATVIEKGEAGEVTLAFDLAGAVPRRGDRGGRPRAAAALHRREAARRTSATAPTTRPSTPREEGAVAAPTAGLHFTPELFARARCGRGIDRAFVTLHVGAGTFLPVKADDTADHRMHAEWGEVPARHGAAP